jgi:hypothetical protein
MFPFDKDKRVRKPSMSGGFDSFFADFEEQMSRMMEMTQGPDVRGYVYGFNSFTGPDGKTYVKEYGNIPGFKAAIQGQPQIEPSGPTCAPATAADGGTTEP